MEINSWVIMVFQQGPPASCDKTQKDTQTLALLYSLFIYGKEEKGRSTEKLPVNAILHSVFLYICPTFIDATRNQNDLWSCCEP